MISVILPTFNRLATIERAIASVLNQNGVEFELIVVDDGSTDRTREVVNSIKNERLQVIRLDSNGGQAAARNAGIRASRGDLIAFQDSDDEWLPCKLKKQLSVIRRSHNDVGLVFSPYLLDDGLRRAVMPKVDRSSALAMNFAKELLVRNLVGTPTMLVKREVFNEVGGFDEKCGALEDWEFAIRVSRSYLLSFDAEPLVVAYVTPGSVSAKNTADIEARQYILHKHWASFERCRFAQARMQYVIGMKVASEVGVVQARKHLIKSAVLQPWRPRYLAAASTAMLGDTAYAAIRAIKRNAIIRKHS